MPTVGSAPRTDRGPPPPPSLFLSLSVSALTGGCFFSPPSSSAASVVATPRDSIARGGKVWGGRGLFDWSSWPRVRSARRVMLPVGLRRRNLGSEGSEMGRTGGVDCVRRKLEFLLLVI